MGLLVLGWGLSARADIREYEVTQENGKPRCTLVTPPKGPTEGDDATSLTVRVKTSADVKNPKLALDDKPPSLALSEDAPSGFFTVTLPKDKLGGAKKLQLVADNGLKCEPFQAAGTPTSTDTGDTTARSSIDVDAVDWWEKTGRKRLDTQLKQGEFPGNTRFLVHFSSGDRAAPFPESISEQEAGQVVVITKANQLTADLVVNTCEDVQTFRVREPAKAIQPQGKSKNYRLVPVGSLIRCGAGKLSYSLKLGNPAVETTTTVRVRPVSHLSFTAAYGFDFVRQRSYSVVNGAISEDVDRSGLGLRLGMTWYPLGVDYENMQWYNYFGNIVLAVDPAAPLERFVAGLGITPTGGLSLLVGGSFQKVTSLKGFAVGDPFTGPGDIPTRKSWRSASIAPYIGLAIDDDIFKVIGTRLTGGK